MKLLLLSTILFSMAAQTPPAPTDAQRLKESQAENQRLRDELAEARKRIKQLEGASSPQKSPDAPPAPASPQAPAASPTAPNPSADLMGNPVAVLDFFQKKFVEDMTKRRVVLPQEKDSKATRQLYASRAKDWSDAINRTSYPVEWRGRIASLGAVKGINQEFEFQCVSADNKSSFGRPVAAAVAKGNAPLLATAMTDREAIWILSATLVPMTYMDPEMVQPNTFDNPPLAGPCVAFKFQLKVLRLYPEKEAPAAAPREN